MKPYLSLLIFFLLLFETYSLLPKRDLPIPPRKIEGGPHYQFGIIHVHSTFSDGGGTVPEIAMAAKGAGIDFVVLTDHNNSVARREGLEKNYDGVDMFVEMEASTPAGHTLTFYSHTSARDLSDDTVNKLSWSHFLGQDTRPGLFLAVAHPSNIKNPWNRLDRHSEGMEVVNFDSVWQRELKESTSDFLLTACLSPFNAFLAALRFFQVYRKDFVAWDTMNSVSRGHFGILAHDTHEKIILNKERSLRWPTYAQTFKLASNVVFLNEAPPTDFEARKKALYESIRGGRSAMLYQTVFPFTGNDWKLVCGETVHRSGADVPENHDSCEFVVDTPIELPYGRVIRLYKDGEIHTESATSGSLRVPLPGGGVYRVEIWAKPVTPLRLLLSREVPYLFYNPIYVR